MRKSEKEKGKKKNIKIMLVYYTMNEQTILISMYTDVSNNLEQIKQSKTKMNHIIQQIEKMDNNFFDVKCDNEIFKKYLNMFNDSNTYHEVVNDLETLKLYLETKLLDKCNHEWVCDLIDIDAENSKHICYCRICEITMK